MKSPLAAKVVIVLGLIVLPISVALGAAPQDPANLTGTTLGPTQIQLDWADNSGDETSFRIERSPDGVLFAQLGTAGADATRFIDNTVTPDAIYYYQVIAVNPDGDSKPSNVISKYTLDSIVPPAPILKTPPNGDQLDTNNVKFEWDSVSDMSGVTYRIIVNDIGNGITLHDVSGITSNNISLLLYDSAYEWYVIAMDGAGNEGLPSESSYCLVVAIDHMAPDTTVTAPNGGEELQGGSTFAITWYALDQDFTSTPDLIIRIFFSRDNGAGWEQIAQLGDNPGAYEWLVPDISCEETCLIRVTTENQAQMIGSDDSDFAFTIIPGSTAGEPGIAGSAAAGGGGGGCTVAGSGGDWKDCIGAFGPLALVALGMGLRRRLIRVKYGH